MTLGLQFGGKYYSIYQQTRGIPQGSCISSLLWRYVTNNSSNVTKIVIAHHPPVSTMTKWREIIFQGLIQKLGWEDNSYLFNRYHEVVTLLRWNHVRIIYLSSHTCTLDIVADALFWWLSAAHSRPTYCKGFSGNHDKGYVPGFHLEPSDLSENTIHILYWVLVSIS